MKITFEVKDKKTSNYADKVEYTAEIKERLKRALPNLPPAIFDNPLIKTVDREALELLEKKANRTQEGKEEK